MALRDRIELGFERWGRFVYRHAWPTILLVVIFSAAFISQLPKITMEMSTEGFLHRDDPTLLYYNQFRDQFERDDRVIIAIRTDDIFDLEFLARLKSFHDDLEAELPQLDEVDSLINARNTRGSEDELIVEELFEDWPRSRAELETIKGYALENPLYPDLLFSPDLRYTTVSLKFDTYSGLGQGGELEGFESEDEFAQPDADGARYLTGEENNRVMAALRKVMARYEQPGFEFAFSGSPVFTERISLGVSGDMRRFLALSFVISMLFLFVLFRRISGTLLPALVVLLSLLTTMGFMPLLGFQLQVPTQILPAFLMAVGVGDSVHILAIFYQRLRKGEEKEDALAFALGHSGLAVVMTSATTAGALLSFAVAALAPVSNLGVLAPIGVMLALIYTLTLLPALLAVSPIRKSGPGQRSPLAFLDRAVVGTGVASTQHPWRVLGVFSAVLIVASIGVHRLEFSHNPMNWFKQNDEIRLHTELLNQELKGAMSMEIIFDTGRENGLHEPEFLNKLDEINRLNREIQENRVFVGKTISLVDVLKETHQALNENRSEYHAVPNDRLLVAQELLLFENSGSDDLEDLVDSQFSLARMTLKIPWIDAIAYPGFIERVQERYEEVVGDAAEVSITGRVPLLSRTFKALITSLSRSYVIAFLVITPLMMLLLASVRWGLVSMVPNLSPILITLGVMGWFDFPLDGFTLLIGSIALGLAVDDTIHFMHNFRRYRDRSGDTTQAVRETLQTTGQALLFTTLVLCASFFIFTLGDMRSTFHFGFLTGFALATAFIADITVAPALVALVKNEPSDGRDTEPVA